jgi:hypothetical protein
LAFSPAFVQPVFAFTRSFRTFLPVNNFPNNSGNFVDTFSRSLSYARWSAAAGFRGIAPSGVRFS